MRSKVSLYGLEYRLSVLGVMILGAGLMVQVSGILGFVFRVEEFGLSI